MSSKLVFLGTNNFKLDNNKNMITNIQGYSMVMFSSSKCQHCANMYSAFAELARRTSFLTLGIVKLEENNSKELIALANRSTIKIEYVPLVVFYNNGLPVMIYSGKGDINDLMEFIESMITSIGNDNQQGNQNTGNYDTTDDQGNNNKLACKIGDEECINGMNKDKDKITTYVTMEQAYSQN